MSLNKVARITSLRYEIELLVTQSFRSLMGFQEDFAVKDYKEVVAARHFSEM